MFKMADVNYSNSLLEGLTDSSTEDSFLLYKAAQQATQNNQNVPTAQLPPIATVKPPKKQSTKIPTFSNTRNPLRLFQRQYPRELKVTKSFIMANLGPTAKSSSVMCSTPANEAFKQKNTSSANSPQFSPINYVKEAKTFEQGKTSGKKKGKNVRRSRSQEPIRNKYSNPMIDSVVEQLQSLSTIYDKQEGSNKNKKLVKQKQSVDNVTFTKITVTNINNLTKEKGVPKKPLASKTSVISKCVGTSPADELTHTKTVKLKTDDLKSPKTDRKRTILVEMQTQTTDSLVSQNRNNKIQEKMVIKESNNIRKDLDIRTQLQFSENETLTPQGSQLQIQDNSNSQPGNVSEHDVEQFLEMFDREIENRANSRNSPTIIEISSTLESREDERDIEVPIKTEVITEEQHNTLVVQSLNEPNDLMRNTQTTAQKHNSKTQRNRTGTDNSNAQSLLTPPTTRSKSKDSALLDNSEKENSTLFKKPTKKTSKATKTTEITATSSGETLSNESITTTTSTQENGNRTRAKRSKKSNKVNTFKAQPSKSNQRKTTSQSQTRLSTKAKPDKTRMTINKRSIKLQPYLAINRFSGFVQIPDLALGSEQEEDGKGLRRSKRDRKHPQLFIQSSILNPAVLRQKSKSKKLSNDNQIDDTATSSRDRTDTTASIESTNDKAVPKTKKQMAKDPKTATRDMELRSHKNDEAGSSSQESTHEKRSKKARGSKTYSGKENRKRSKLSTETIDSSVDNDNTFVRPLPMNENSKMHLRGRKKNEAVLPLLRETEEEKTFSQGNESKYQSRSRKKNHDADILNNYVSETIDSGVCVSVTLNNAGTMEIHEEQNNVPIQISSFNNDTNDQVEQPRNNTCLEELQVHGAVSSYEQNSVPIQISSFNNEINDRVEQRQSETVLPTQNSSRQILNCEQNHVSVQISSFDNENNNEVEQRQNDSATLTQNFSRPRLNSEAQDSLIPENNPEMMDDLDAPILCNTNDEVSVQDISRKRSVTFRVPSTPKKKKLLSQKGTKELPGTSTESDTATKKRNVTEEIMEDEDNHLLEETDCSNDILHTIINKEVASFKWAGDTPTLPSCSNSGNNINVKYVLKNIPSSWGHTSTGYVIIGAKRKKSLQVLRKYNVSYKVDQGHGIVVANGKNLNINVGKMFYIPVGTEYSITNLSDQPLILWFQKNTA